MSGLLSLSAHIVEPIIALSVAYVAIDNLVTSELKIRRLAAVCFFGFFHGIRFAEVLNEVSVPPSRLITGVVMFGAGVAAGLFATVALASLVVIGYRHRAWYHQRIVVPVSLAIAVVGVYWTIARTIG